MQKFKPLNKTANIIQPLSLLSAVILIFFFLNPYGERAVPQLILATFIMITTNTAIISTDNQPDLPCPSSYCYLFRFIAAANSKHLTQIFKPQLCFAVTVS